MKEPDFSRLELNELKTRMALLELHAERIDKLEKSLLHNEIVLAEKISKLLDVEKRLNNSASHEHIKIINKKISKLGVHEDVLAENALALKQLFSEIDKVSGAIGKLQERINEAKLQETTESNKRNNREESIGNRIAASQRMEHSGSKALASQIQYLDAKLSDRLSQVEYQNRLIMKYLKKIDEQLF